MVFENFIFRDIFIVLDIHSIHEYLSPLWREIKIRDFANFSSRDNFYHWSKFSPEVVSS